jgi:hypothetical protein
MNRKPFVIHPLLFSIYAIVFLYAHNVDAVRVVSTLRPLVIVVMSGLILHLILSVILRDTKKAGIICSVTVLLFFSYQHIYRLMQVVDTRHRFLIPVLGLILLFVIIWVIRTIRCLTPLTQIFNVAALFLIIMALFQIFWFKIQDVDNVLLAEMNREDERITVQRSHQAPERPPDIYYIILDAYGRADAVKNIYGYDNSAFIDYLRQKGFYVASRSTSNYFHTLVSLASSLNYEYINPLSKVVGETSRNKRPLKEMIEDNRIYRFLRQYNYKFIVFASGSETTAYNRYADIVLKPPQDITEFERTLIYNTPFPVIQDFLVQHKVFDEDTFGVWYFSEWRQRILFILDGLKNVPETHSPKFVFAHIIDPHPPYVFNREGGSTIKKNEIEAHVDELIHLNNGIRNIINEILSKSGKKPIIIIQGDHGFTPDSRTYPEKVFLQSRFSILNAYYLPYKDHDMLYESISPVNSFRIILNTYFGTNYDLRPDMSYFSTVIHPYKLSDITHQIKDRSAAHRKNSQHLTSKR